MEEILREKIAHIINDRRDDRINEQNADEIALEIIGYLDKRIGLYGNGWLDNDKVMLEYLDYD